MVSVFWFDIDESKPYMEYYATHRLGSDRHYRIYETGELIKLDVLRPENSIETNRIIAQSIPDIVKHMLREGGYSQKIFD